ncbi:hypothetical protein FRX31_023530 [Thalictrum thalictroides]|uniref:Uncharacterized protein n=1 Tax=Thalictrum thalictroides TaxID=46969 RepID=A0A7J6VRM0_THATH|nr:hypothetical protein FRX31_023530 [Thalictrum thalictroides]
MRTLHIFIKPLEERSSDSVYVEAVRFLGKIITFGLVIVAITGLVSSRNENPAVPLRLWTFVYALQNIYSVFMFMWYPSSPLLSKSSSTTKGVIALGSQ